MNLFMLEIGLDNSLEEHGIVRAALARAISVHPSTLKGYLERDNIELYTLIKISNVLEHNFIREIADKLPATYPPKPAISREKEVADMQLKIDQQAVEIKILKEALQLLGGKATGV